MTQSPPTCCPEGISLSHISTAAVKPRVWKTLRVIILCGVFLALYPLAMERRYPPAAPRHVQVEGEALVRHVLEKLQETPFGVSPRGRALVEESIGLLDRKRLVFSASLGGPRGLTVSRILGPRRIYLKVIQVGNDLYIQQLDWQLAEALIHEALHSLRGGFGAASFEEECDAFAAGFQAEAALRNIEPPHPLMLDGLSVAEFVRRNYPGIKGNPAYKPLFITKEELVLLTGM